MCGIFACRPIVNEWLENSILKHQERGPDQSAINTFKDIGISVNRLAITGNLEEGSQPVFSSSKDTLCVFNGAIYNTDELKKQFSLEVKSKNEAAVLMELYEIMGEEFVAYIKGMYSIILIDKRNEFLFVTRDNYGIKPLYWVNKEQQYIFSSSLEAIPKNFLPSVSAFPPGAIWINGSFRKRTKTKIPLYKNFENLLIDTVESQIPKEVEWGCALSGGLDSSLLCAIARSLGYKFNCYTLDTGEGEDRLLAQQVSSHLALPLQSVKVTQNDIEMAIPKLVKSIGSFQQELIIGGLLTYFISRAANNDGLKVLLFGEGADEVFGGYEKYKRIGKTRSNKVAEGRMIHDLYHLWLTHNKRVDHASMAASIEARVPYQDPFLAGNARKLSFKLKIDPENPFQDKIVLRLIANKYLPASVTLRKKTTISQGSNLNQLVKRSLTNITSKYELTSINEKTRMAFNIRSNFETLLFSIWRETFPNMCEDIHDMIGRGLYSKMTI